MEKPFNEPINYFVEKYGVDILNIKKIICGKKYSAVMLKNGNIGVCANLFNPVDVKIEDLKSLDLRKFEHRIIVNAYFNASLNYLNKYDDSGDIFEIVDFVQYQNIIMIGLFQPLLEKFDEKNIKITVFDLIKQSIVLSPLGNKIKYVKKADAIILSATTIFNETFMNILTNSGEDCDIFLLGPSSIMSKDLFAYKNITKIFGSIFLSNDERVLNIINDGYGTKKFLPFGKKVCLFKS